MFVRMNNAKHVVYLFEYFINSKLDNLKNIDIFKTTLLRISVHAEGMGHTARDISCTNPNRASPSYRGCCTIHSGDFLHAIPRSEIGTRRPTLD